VIDLDNTSKLLSKIEPMENLSISFQLSDNIEFDPDKWNALVTTSTPLDLNIQMEKTGNIIIINIHSNAKQDLYIKEILILNDTFLGEFNNE
jgi:hypothetical protein